MATPTPGGSGPETSYEPRSWNESDITILVVEDELLIRMCAVEYLRNMGHRVVEVSNADDAVDVMKAGAHINVVFSDISMPGKINGIELARWIKHEYANVITILTSAAPHLMRDAGYQHEEDKFFEKPYQLEVVHRCIKMLTTPK